MYKGLDERDVIIGRFNQTQALTETVKDGFKGNPRSSPGN